MRQRGSQRVTENHTACQHDNVTDFPVLNNRLLYDGEWAYVVVLRVGCQTSSREVTSLSFTWVMLHNSLR